MPPEPRGPVLRTDIVDVYLLRPSGPSFEVLQLRRASAPLAGTWHPLMGHVEPGETALACCIRECAEETGLNLADPAGCTELLALGGVHPFFMAALDAVVCSPRFVAVVPAGFEPLLNHEHDDFRWVPLAGVDGAFMWPGQRAALEEAAGLLLDPARLAARSVLRVRR